MASIPLIYWDTNVFIALIIAGQILRKQIARALLEDARLGKMQIVTSAFTLAELRKGENEQPLSADQRATILAFFEHDYITVIQLDRTVAHQAAIIGEQCGLKPPDAVHLASAIRVKAAAFQTWDEHFFRERVLQNCPLLIQKPTRQGGVQTPLPL